MSELGPVERAVSEGRLPREILDKARERTDKLRECIREVERASSVKYPAWYIRPELVLMRGGEMQEEAIVFSRFMPLSLGQGLGLYVEFTLPLVLYASMDTLTAVAAHELLHYLNFLVKIRDMRVASSQLSTSVFEARYLDEEELLSPERVFGRRRSRILRLLSEKFSGGLNDQPLVERAVSRWIKKGLPVVYVSPEENAVRVSLESLLSFVPEESARRVLNWT